MQEQSGPKRGLVVSVIAVGVVAIVAAMALWVVAQRSGDATTSPPAGGSEKPNRDVPAVSYYDASERTVHRANGDAVRVAVKSDVLSFTELADGRLLFVVSRGGGASDEPPAADLVEFDEKGAELQRSPSWGYGLTSTADGEMAAWIGDKGTPMVLVSGAEEPVKLDPMTTIAESRIEPVQVTGDCSADEGCTVFAVDTTTSPTLWESSTVFPAQRYAGDGGVAVAPDGRYFLERTSASDEKLCVGLWNRESIGGEAQPDPLGEECMPGMLGPHYEFSPDGRWIVAQHGEGYGPAQTQILDGRTLKVVATASEKGATYHDVAWEGDDSVLLVVDYDQRGLETGEYELQRLTSAGKVEKLGITASRLPSR